MGRAGIAGGSEDSRRIAAALRALQSASELPGPLDAEGSVPPVGRAWVRRLPNNTWIWYRERDGALYALFVTRTPPEPVD